MAAMMVSSSGTDCELMKRGKASAWPNSVVLCYCMSKSYPNKMTAQRCSRLSEYTGIPFSSQILTVRVCDLSDAWSGARITSCKISSQQNQCKWFLFYLAVVAFSGHQGSGCMHDSLFWFANEDVWNHCFHTMILGTATTTNFWVGSKYVSSRSELNDALILSKDCWQSTGLVHLMSLVNSLLSGALIWRSEGGKFP